ncbi:KAT8 regulatory NSL complex subunit 2-like [Ostrea edulis]|uniref:KAT8 regulatory NSL complex subunit 2-like n=1 Tax=Ostrea edulis TaxID=37623 RepID=UPI0024AFA6C5|nr:KAT8 regulatory NSL complex subunit 2-like [Ostrea edulis]XP_055997088.1 KAT8 regulatory NSL complex subunit 2-like [Ostrea edulis]
MMAQRQPKVHVNIRKPRSPPEGQFCLYSHRTCTHNKLPGYDFCTRHILEDKNAPYKQCEYSSSKNGKRCINAATKSDKKGNHRHCNDHAKKAILLRQKAHFKRRCTETADSLLEDLDHYKLVAGPDGVLEHQRQHTVGDNLASRALDYASSSDSDLESPLVDQAWRGDGDSDAESIDSDQEDLLKYAGVYTAEEVALIMRDKLIRLQSLYIDQFKRLQHVMKEKRRKYLQTTKQEREALGSIKYYKKRVTSRDKYSQLKVLKRYHKRQGKEALLHRQSKQRRIAISEGYYYRAPAYPRCIFSNENSVKCLERAVPLSKYCKKHIGEDQYQVLFRPCQFGGGACGKQVFSLDDCCTCPTHLPLKNQETRVSLKIEENADPLDVKSTELTKEALDLLLPQLDFSAQEIMSRQLLSENPEMPDSIFSITEADTTESMDPSEQLNNTADQSEMVLLAEEKSEKISCSDTAEDGPEHGPLLLQHLQGTYEYSHSRSSSKNSEAAASQSSVSTETASESAMERKDFTDNEEDNKLAEMTDVC